MTEKRFTHKKWYNERQLFDDDEPFAIVDVWIQADMICDKLNEQHETIERLKRNFKALDEVKCEIAEENEQLKSDLEYYRETYSIQEYGLDIETYVQLSSPILSRKELLKENEQLKQDIKELQNDKLLTELQMKCDKKQEHIVVLENKIRRMREAIHKLEWLSNHRNADLIRENEQLKSELKGMEELLKSYRKTIKHDAELLADATKNGYLPPLEDWKKGDVE